MRKKEKEISPMCGSSKLIDRVLPDGIYLTGFIVREKNGHYFINTTVGVDFHDLDSNLQAINATYFPASGSKEEIADEIKSLNDQFDLPGFNPIEDILLRKKAA